MRRANRIVLAAAVGEVAAAGLVFLGGWEHNVWAAAVAGVSVVGFGLAVLAGLSVANHRIDAVEANRDFWHARWEEEHDAFRSFIRSTERRKERDRSA